ncbi:MAG: dipeptidase [Syntrophomonas sp.]|nr:dipeptidase [Syntrophomonas sp.]
MKVIDLHCDTISCLSLRDAPLYKNDIQFDLARAKKANLYLQFFALFTMPADRNTTLRNTLKQIEKFLAEIEDNSKDAYHLRCSSDLLLPENMNRLACILHLEGAECLGNDIEILRILYRLGLRSMGLTWNYRNLLADGVGEGKDAGGLSRKGKVMIEEMARLGIMLDLAHISPKSFYDALDCYSKPVLVTHANAQKLCPHWRNLDDSQLKALADHGGVVGVTQVADFIKEENATMDDFLDHIKYITDLIGVEHVSLGSDFDGADNMVIKQVEGYGELPEIMAQRGFAQPEIEMILGENALNIIRQVI